MNEGRTIQRILRVNHAGEYGAIRIYNAQIVVAEKFYPDVLGFLKETIEHEKEHCAKFLSLLKARHGRPCRTMFLWSWGGYLLGLVSTLMGRQGIMICTEVVEETVHKHMKEQILFLRDHDKEACELVESIQEEELQHLRYAQDNVGKKNIFNKLFQSVCIVMVEIVIWLSTWGDSQRLKKEIGEMK